MVPSISYQQMLHVMDGHSWDGNQTSQKTTGDSGLNPARYHLNMSGISYDAVHQNNKKMTIKISYKIQKVKDGYSDLRISYHTRSDNKNHNE